MLQVARPVFIGAPRGCATYHQAWWAQSCPSLARESGTPHLSLRESVPRLWFRGCCRSWGSELLAWFKVLRRSAQESQSNYTATATQCRSQELLSDVMLHSKYHKGDRPGLWCYPEVPHMLTGLTGINTWVSNRVL
jgi:hypothetical protein